VVPVITHDLTRFHPQVDEGVLVRAGGRTGLSDTAKTRLSESKKRFGPFESLSPFKRSQFLKTVVGKAPPKRASTRQSRRKTVSVSLLTVHITSFLIIYVIA